MKFRNLNVIVRETGEQSIILNCVKNPLLFIPSDKSIIFIKGIDDKVLNNKQLEFKNKISSFKDISDEEYTNLSLEDKELKLLEWSFSFLNNQTEKGRFIIMDEPEIGLCRKNIKKVLIEIINLINIGHQVIIRTRSDIFIDFLLVRCSVRPRNLKEAFGKLLNIVDLKFFDNFINKSVLIINEGEGYIKDITRLGLLSDDPDLVTVGGMYDFSQKANDVIDNY